MRNKTIFHSILLLSLILLSFTGQTTVVSADFNSWTSIGPDGGGIVAFAANPSNPAVVYAGTGFGGVFKSTNGGGSWIPVNTGLTTTSINDLTIDPVTPSILYTATYEGIFKSTDGANSWIQMNTGLTSPYYIFTLAIDPSTPTTLYAGSNNDVFKSTNSGESWNAINNGLNNAKINDLAIDPVTPANIYAGTSAGLFKSINGGETWSPANTGLTSLFGGTLGIGSLAINPTTPSILYAVPTVGMTQTSVYKSTDSADNWSPTTCPSNSVYTLTIDPKTPQTLFAGGTPFVGAIQKSIDGGDNWTAATTGLGLNDVRALLVNPQSTDTLYAGTEENGVYKSTDSAGSWDPANDGLAATTINALAINPISPSTLYVALFNGKVVKTTDGGVNWNLANEGLDGWYVSALAINPGSPDIVYAGTDGGVFKSTDGGDHWNPFNSGLGLNPNSVASVYTLIIDPTAPNVLFAGADTGIYKTTDGAVSWNPAGDHMGDLYNSNIWIDPNASTVLYAVSIYSKLYKSVNSGTNWNLMDIGNNVSAVYCIAIDPHTSATLYSGTDKGVYKSTNGGGNWTLADAGLAGEPVYWMVVDPNSPTSVFASTLHGVFFSSNGGQSWNAFNDGLTNPIVEWLKIDAQSPTKLYAETQGGGVFTREVKPGTVLTVTSSKNPSVFGDAVTYTASLQDAKANPLSNAEVIFKDGSQTIGNSSTDSNGIATFSPSAKVSAGSHKITASFAGDATHMGSIATEVNQQVDKALTTTVITTDLSAATRIGVSYAVSVTVTSLAGAPTGSVVVTDGERQCSIDLASATSCQLTSATGGTKTITASYSGDSNFLPSHANTSHNVQAAVFLPLVLH